MKRVTSFLVLTVVVAVVASLMTVASAAESDAEEYYVYDLYEQNEDGEGDYLTAASNPGIAGQSSTLWLSYFALKAHSH